MTGRLFACLLGITGAAMLTATSFASSAEEQSPHRTGSPFCQARTLFDFTTPLEKLPKIRETPRESELYFDSNRVSFAKRSDAIVVNGDSIDYRFLSTEKFTPSFSLDVESRLVSINREGQVVRTVKQRVERAHLNQAKPYDVVGFAHSPPPGLYRYDLSFRESGKSAGSYRDYYRVVKKSADVRLRLNDAVFTENDRVLGKIENYTAESVNYNIGYAIQRYQEGDWLPVPLDQLLGYQVKFRGPAFRTGPGSAGPCSALLAVPPTMEPGRYRMVKFLNPYFRKRRTDPRPIVSEFRIED
jgi:hypothetical protein